MTVSANASVSVGRFYFEAEAEGERGVAKSFYFPDGAEEVRFGADATRDVAELCEKFGYERPFVFSSRTLNRTTDVVDRIAESIGMKLVGRSDRVGEHAPVSNVIAAISEVREADADVLVCIGGGSVMDFGKFVQLGATEGVHTREELRALTVDRAPELNQRPELRQITIPTTFSLSEWTPAGTPVDDATGKKITFRLPDDVGRAIVYDPDIVRHTPVRLALVTAIRGLDHSINTLCSAAPMSCARSLRRRRSPSSTPRSRCWPGGRRTSHCRCCSEPRGSAGSARCRSRTVSATSWSTCLPRGPISGTARPHASRCSPRRDGYVITTIPASRMGPRRWAGRSSSST